MLIQPPVANHQPQPKRSQRYDQSTAIWTQNPNSVRLFGPLRRQFGETYVLKNVVTDSRVRTPPSKCGMLRACCSKGICKAKYVGSFRPARRRELRKESSHLVDWVSWPARENFKKRSNRFARPEIHGADRVGTARVVFGGLQEDADVLDSGDHPVLNLLSPQSPPP